MSDERPLSTIADSLDAVIDLARERERELATEIAAVPDSMRVSARNLAHYLALRSIDLRPLQDRLAARGLSSLGRAEDDVLGALETLASVVRRLDDGTTPLVDHDPAGARARLAAHAEQLLGPAPQHRPARVMVTLPSTAASDAAWVRSLVAAGVETVRINCAHDGPTQWLAMAENIRAAARSCGRVVRIQADLAGPKLRTGTALGRRNVLRLRPLRDHLGATIAPATIPLRAIGTAGVGVGLPADLLAALRDHDELRLRDARGRKRRWVVERKDHFVVARCDRTSYVTPGLELELRRRGKQRGRVRLTDDLVDDGLPLVVDARLWLVSEAEARRRRPEAPAVGCQAPQVFTQVRAGERILFDDGKLAGVVERAGADGLLVRIDRTRPGGATLRGDRGINLPDSAVALALPGERDLAALYSLVDHIDLVGLSFVHERSEVAQVRRLLDEAGHPELGIVLKVETRRAFERLPELLFAALAAAPAGVMVARGDLAVEVGFERLAEVQEEILWLCQAAQLPCIWATQVLDTLARTGQPSRAEVTDAAMGARAECVMLNKGPFVIEAVRTLVDVLQRMDAHQGKKRSLLRRLAVTGRLPQPGGT